VVGRLLIKLFLGGGVSFDFYFILWYFNSLGCVKKTPNGNANEMRQKRSMYVWKYGSGLDQSINTKHVG